MKLRMPGKDYSDPGYYFCTLVVRGRRQLFGKVVSVSDAEHQSQHTQNQSQNTQNQTQNTQSQTQNTQNQTQSQNSQNQSQNSLGGYVECGGENVLRSQLNALYPFGHSTPHNGACIAYSPYGQLITRELKKISSIGQYAGKVEVKGKQIMPDHLHVLILIKEQIPKPLGTLLNGFIVGCRRAWKELQASPNAQYQTTAPEPQADGALSIFEKGYNDNVVYRSGQLDGYYKYMAANPWRWLLREKYPNLFCKVWGKELLPGHRFDLIGNMFLLDKPWHLPVRISRFAVKEEAFNPYNPEGSFILENGKRVLRRTQYLFPRREKTQEEIQNAIQPYLKLAKAGAVLITPCISPAEKEVVQAAYKENMHIVMLCHQGFDRYYHPSKAHYDACARGILLQLAPWKYDPGRELRKQLCEELNDMAFRFAGL